MKADTKSRGRFALAYPWALHRRLGLKAAGPLTRCGMGRLSLALLEPLEPRGLANVEVVEALFRTYGKLGMTAKAAEYRARILRGRAARAARAKGMDRPIQNLLRALAGLEDMQLAAPLAATLRLSELMVDDDGLTALLDASEPVIAEHPDSILVVYVRAVALAKKDRIDEALALVRTTTEAVASREASTAMETRVRRSLLTNLANVWRVVDAIARDKMAWAGAGPGHLVTGDGVDHPPDIGQIGQQGPPDACLHRGGGFAARDGLGGRPDQGEGLINAVFLGQGHGPHIDHENAVRVLRDHRLGRVKKGGQAVVVDHQLRQPQGRRQRRGQLHVLQAREGPQQILDRPVHPLGPRRPRGASAQDSGPVFGRLGRHSQLAVGAEQGLDHLDIRQPPRLQGLEQRQGQTAHAATGQGTGGFQAETAMQGPRIGQGEPPPGFGVRLHPSRSQLMGVPALTALDTRRPSSTS